MPAKEIWVPEQTAPLQLVQQFRSKLRLDFESKLTDYLEDKDIDQDDLTLEEFFQIMLKIEKRLAIKQNKKSPFPHLSFLEILQKTEVYLF